MSLLQTSVTGSLLLKKLAVKVRLIGLHRLSVFQFSNGNNNGKKVMIRPNTLIKQLLYL
jgi:hypothetical protein